MDKKSSDFIKLAYKYGKVKEVQEAFKEYPVENEWHKGNIELVVKEESEEYNLYCIGDIVFVKEFLYESGKIGNNHLFVIIDQDNLVVPIENFGMLISSQLNKLRFETNIMLKKDEENGLNRDSLVKTDVIYKIDTKQILFKIGHVDDDKVEEYKQAFLKNI